MANEIFTILLILHVGAVVAWLGGGSVFVSVVSPALKGVTQSARGEFLLSALPRYIKYLEASAIIAILAGLGLYAYSSMSARSASPFSFGTIYIDIGAILGLIAFIVVFVLVIPSARKSMVILKQSSKVPLAGSDATSRGNSNDLASLSRKMSAGAGYAVGTLTLALIFMIIGASV
ncbi:MAG: hypothetical protein ACREBS_02685 [Nitrososphaerales archaeon]